MPFELPLADLATLGQVVVIDIVLAGDNAIVVGLAAAGLHPEQRRRAILIGVVAALVCRVLFSVVALHLLAIVGLTLAGGLLLAWVAWKMWRELRAGAMSVPAEGDAETAAGGVKTFASAVWQIAIADVSMSLDNVLAVAGAARDHLGMLVFGLMLSVALMGAAASFIARWLERYRWLAFCGLAVIVYVALSMIYEGVFDVQRALGH